jgi:hypothetical protein
MKFIITENSPSKEGFQNYLPGQSSPSKNGGNSNRSPKQGKKESTMFESSGSSPKMLGNELKL